MSLCEGCHAGCCRSFAVPVTGADILRIEQQRGLSFWDFACRWADPEGQIAQKYAPHFRFKDDPKTPFVICLMHVPSASFPGTTKCHFLEETPPSAEYPRGLGRCGIHPSRPGACRAFPTKLNHSGDLAVIYDVPPRGRADDSPAYALCPRPWQPSDLNPIEAVQDLVVARFEMNFFHELARMWNRALRPWGVFPDFLRLAYAGRVLREQEPVIDLGDQHPATIPFPGVGEAPGGRRAAA